MKCMICIVRTIVDGELRHRERRRVGHTVYARRRVQNLDVLYTKLVREIHQGQERVLAVNVPDILILEGKKHRNKLNDFS